MGGRQARHLVVRVAQLLLAEHAGGALALHAVQALVLSIDIEHVLGIRIREDLRVGRNGAELEC